MDRGEKIARANEIADYMAQGFKELKNSRFGRLKYIGLDSLSVMAGLAVGGVCRTANLELQTTATFIIGFAMPNLITASTLPRPNRLSDLVNYETAKYLMGAIALYAHKLYGSFSLLL